VAKQTQTPTSEEQGGKLPIDFAGADERGNVRLGKATEKEATLPAPEAQKGEAGGEEAKTPKAYSQKELDERIATAVGGHEGTVKKMRDDYKTIQQRLDNLQTQYDERELDGWIATIEKDGGNVDLAKQMAERERATKKVVLELARREAALSDKEAILNEAGKVKTAHDLAKSYELGDEAVDELLKAETMEAMENKALKLQVEKLRVLAQKPEEPDKGLGDMKGIDISKLSLTQRLGLAAEGKI